MSSLQRPQTDSKKDERLRKNIQFKEVYLRGRRLKGPHFTILVRPNQLAHSRMGLSVTKRNFKLSVCRHKIQRRLREAYRLIKGGLLPGYDIVIRADHFNLDEGKPSFTAIKEELLCLAQKAGVACPK